MKKRTITGIVMFLVIVPFLVIDVLIIPLQVLIGLALIVGAIELMRMFNKEYSIVTKIYVILLTLLLYLSIILPIDTNYILLTLLIIVGILLLLSAFNEEFTGDNLGKHLTTILYVGLSTSALMSIRFLGVRFILYLLAITSITDVFAYLIGTKFGKHKMAPNISPNKSWEGAISGTIIAVTIVSLGSIFYGKIFTGIFVNADGIETLIDNVGNFGTLPLYLKSIIIICVTFLISISGQVGDLVASKMKRNYEIKDFGKVFPGHGGVLDRFDSAFFASIVLYIALLFIQIV